MCINRIKACIEREFYRPSALGLFINPFFITRRGLLRHVSALAGEVRGCTLDVGCGSKPYQDLFASTEYIGMELDTPPNRARAKANLFYDGIRFPLNDETFSSVVSNQVLEHVFDPKQFLSEIHRVLQSEGTLLLTAPFVWDEHEQPCDYLRYSSFGIKALLEQHGFQIIRQEKTVNDIRAVFQMLIAYIYKKTASRNAYLNLLATIILMAPFTLMAELLCRILPKNDDLYLDNVVLARKIGISPAGHALKTLRG